MYAIAVPAFIRWWNYWWMMLFGLALVAGFIGSILAAFYYMQAMFLVGTLVCAWLLSKT